MRDHAAAAAVVTDDDDDLRHDSIRCVRFGQRTEGQLPPREGGLVVCFLEPVFTTDPLRFRSLQKLLFVR